MRGGLIAVWTISLLACIDAPGTVCDDGRLCPAGHLCIDREQTRCVLPEQLDSCDQREDGADCSYPGVSDGTCGSGVCVPSGCGNDVREASEVCDDGNEVGGDGCSHDCQSDETCGNGVLDRLAGEACDDGKHCDDGTMCTEDEQCAGIGDGVCAPRGSDECQPNCRIPGCGDGITDPMFAEACDCGTDADNLPQGCNGVNSMDSNATCRPNCQPSRCGDGVRDDTEACDDGDLEAGDGCTPDCQSDETCGNGITDFLAGEECDDGDTLDNDACTHTCTLTSPWWRAGPSGSPPLVDNAAAVYHTTRGQVVRFSGAISGAPNNETWVRSGTHWARRFPDVSPPARQSHAMAYDVHRDRVVLFGGSGFADDTWEWDGRTWANKTPLGGSPIPFSNHAMVYDPVRRVTVLFAGSSSLASTWTWNGAVWTELSPSTSPPGRLGHAMTFDAKRGVVVLFGGLADGVYLSDTWEWDGTNWSEVTTATSPPARSDHGMTYDAARSVTILHGGGDGAATLTKTWQYDGTNWSEIATTPPPLRPAPAMVYDSARRLVVMVSQDAVDEWDGATWTTISSTPAVSPTPRRAMSLAPDPVRGRVVLFGGEDSTGTLAETWEWDGHTWRDRSAPGSPPGRVGATAAYDSTAQQVLVFGGINGATYLDDLWGWDGAVWSNRTPSMGPNPAARAGAGIAYDSDRERLVLFGGLASDGSELADTWEWDGTSWVDATPVGQSPGPTLWQTMTYDAKRKRVVLFGGSSGLLGRTWEWDGTSWTERIPTLSPASRVFHVMVYDPTRERVVLFGGGLMNVQTFSDTWEWDGTDWRETSPANGPGAVAVASAAFDAARGRTVLFGGDYGASTFTDELWLYGSESELQRESCLFGFDVDGDGAIGCDDPDCWGYCTPLCPPSSSCPSPSPGCGDGICVAEFETCRLCPADCGACSIDCGDALCEGTETATSCPGDCS